MASYFLWHKHEIDSVAHELKTDLEQGLSNKESASRLVSYGPNELPEPESIQWGDVLLRQQVSLMIPFMLLASILLIMMNQLINAAIVFCVLIISFIISVFQEVKSSRNLHYLIKTARNSMYAKVLRNGHVNLVKTRDLVPGDIICFETGDQIPADGRLIETKYLILDELALTNMDAPVEKDAGVLDEDVQFHQMKNMVFTGSFVRVGNGRAIITATGKQTRFAQIMKNRDQKPNQFLFESEVSGKGLWFAGGCIILSAILWGAFILFGIKKYDAAILSLSFLMAAWPMGLIEAVRSALIGGMKKLSDSQIIIRKLPGAEILANVTSVCSNEKGIMTQGRMAVKKLFVDGHIMNIDNIDYNSPTPDGPLLASENENPDLPLLLTAASMCTNTVVKSTPEGWSIDGDSTEAALIITAMKGGINKDELGLSLTRVAEIPYDPERKRMTAIVKYTNGELYAFTKGSLETILDVCRDIQLHGYADVLDNGRIQAIWAVNQNFARDLSQSMAFAYCKLDEELEYYTVESVERDLIFVGMMGMVDVLRTDTEQAVKKCLAGSIKPIIFTDDYEDTAFSFAKNLGLIQSESEVLSGEYLDTFGEGEFFEKHKQFSVYADISPAHKPRIIRALKDSGEVVAMIGGDKNDVIAIEEADVGIAPGRTGSSVSVNASDIVLLDDSFAAAVSAIEGARSSSQNAKKAIRYLLSGSLATACTIFIAMIINTFWHGSPIPPLSLLHVLWINLIAGSIPVIAIVLNPSTEDLMKEGAYMRGNVFSDELKTSIFIRGILTAIFALIVYISAFVFMGSWDTNQDHAKTATLTILVMSQLAFAFQCNCPTRSFFHRFFANKLLLGLAFLVILLQLAVIYTPFINTIFGTKSLSLLDWAPILLAFLISFIPMDEVFTTHVEEEEKEPEKQKDDKKEKKIIQEVEYYYDHDESVGEKKIIEDKPEDTQKDSDEDNKEEI